MAEFEDVVNALSETTTSGQAGFLMTLAHAMQAKINVLVICQVRQHIEYAGRSTDNLLRCLSDVPTNYAVRHEKRGNEIRLENGSMMHFVYRDCDLNQIRGRRFEWAVWL